MRVKSRKVKGLRYRALTPWGRGVVQGPWNPWGLALGALRVSGWKGLVRRAVLVGEGSGAGLVAGAFVALGLRVSSPDAVAQTGHRVLATSASGACVP